MSVSIKDIRAAQKTLAGQVVRTPLVPAKRRGVVYSVLMPVMNRLR